MKEIDKLKAILDQIADGVFVIDKDWRIEFFNAAAEKITGFSAKEAIGKKCRDILRSNVCDYNCVVRHVLDTGKPVINYENEIVRKDNRSIPISESASLLRDEEANVIGAIITFRDLSQIKQLTEELQTRYQFDNIIGKSYLMQEIYDLIEIVADSDATVLIQGESGTGKELIAEAIHYNSKRADKPLVKINCSALPESLLESELFGHVKGAFTDAINDRVGRFEMADGGSLFLDEIGEISQKTQVKLLRVLERQEFERVGETKSIKVDVRLISATNLNLREEVQKGNFRDDLFYRLNVVMINVPPLRDRREDIPLLIEHFIQQFNYETGKNVKGVSSKSMDLLIDYSWPGNVRELENAIEHAFVHCQGGLIVPEHLPDEIRKRNPILDITQISDDPLATAEKEVILNILDRTGWHIGKTAEKLKLSRTTLWRRMKKYGISRDE